MDLISGDIVTVAPPGEFGKPRPALILQKLLYPKTEVITVALITSSHWDLPEVRLPILRTAETGLERDSFVVIHMVQTCNRGKIRKRLGTADESVTRQVRQPSLVSLASTRIGSLRTSFSTRYQVVN